MNTVRKKSPKLVTVVVSLNPYVDNVKAAIGADSLQRLLESTAGVHVLRMALGGRDAEISTSADVIDNLRRDHHRSLRFSQNAIGEVLGPTRKTRKFLSAAKVRTLAL
jgi:hypothetical protein